jgi:hypothetical protein
MFPDIYPQPVNEGLQVFRRRDTVYPTNFYFNQFCRINLGVAMRKVKLEDEGIKGMLRDEFRRCQELVEQVRQAMSAYPKGCLVVKRIKAKGHVYEYHHLQWRDGSKVISRHINKKEVPDLKSQIEQREAYRNNCAILEKRLEYLASLLGEKKSF